MTAPKKNLVLKKHVATIHSTNKLSLLQRKIANALLFNAYDELLTKDEHQIHIATLCKLIGYESHDHKTIKKALVTLLATVIEWNLVDGNRLDIEGVWNASSIIADASIDGPICHYSYSNKMRHLLYQPELYGRLNMVVQAKFKSTYGLALYENCIRFQGIEQTPWFDLINFRKLMGVEENKYKIFRDFKHRVLDKAVEEVNKYSSISVIPQFKKRGRQVVSIQFEIKPSKKIGRSVEDKQLPLSETLKADFGLSAKQIEEVMSFYEEIYIREKMNLIGKSKTYLAGKINNLAKYLICALKEDFQPTKQSKNQVESINDEKIELIKTKMHEQRQAEEYQRYQNKEMIKSFNLQTAVFRSDLLSQFEHYLGKGIYYDIYLRDGLSNILIQDQLCMFLRQKKPEFVNATMSYQTFCQSQEKNDLKK